MKVTKLVTLAFLIAFASACTPPSQNDSESANVEKEARPVKTMIVKKESIDRTLSYTSTLIPFEELNYAPSQPGRISKIHVEVGDRVKKRSNPG